VIEKIQLWMTKNPRLVTWAGAMLILSLAFGFLFFEYKAGHTDGRLKAMIVEQSKLKKDFSEFKKKYHDVEIDRNNVLLQTKLLLADKSKLSELQESFDELKKDNEAITSQKDKLHQENEKLSAERDTGKRNFEKLKTAYLDIQGKHETLDHENAVLKKALAAKVQEAPEFKKLSQEAKGLKSDNAKLNGAIKNLQDKLKKALDRMSKIDGRDKKFSSQIQALMKQVRDLKAENNKLVELNKKVNEVAKMAPDRFRDMAEQNKTLIKETAEMHYNMGVFFTDNHNTLQAVKEFKRALEFDPNNAKVHYNLGYLYAEELGQQDEALAHFNRFLELSPNAKESEAIRSFMLTRQAYGDKIASAKR